MWYRIETKIEVNVPDPGYGSKSNNSLFALQQCRNSLNSSSVIVRPPLFKMYLYMVGPGMSKSMLSNASCRGLRLAKQYFLISLYRASVHVHGYVSGLSFGIGIVALGRIFS